MASFLKLPSKQSKGVLIFTSQEKLKFIDKDKKLYQRIEKLKVNWIIGLHHNWHNFEYIKDELYDFDMAGESDLKVVNNKKIHHIPIECTHFSQDFFKFTQNEKMWDILYVARAINFKRIPEFFNIIRQLYDNGEMYRVLFISPVPPNCQKNKLDKSQFCNIRDVYNSMFSQDERKLFNLITMDYEYPFPFDIETLSHFYKSSRVFVFTSDDERRPRTVSYAMACGMPTVLMPSVASLLPESKQHKPLVYLANSFDEYQALINEAIEFTKSDNYTKEIMVDAINEFDANYNLNRLRDELKKVYDIDIFEENKSYLIPYNLDIRLARHHGFGDSSNSIGWSIASLLNYLEQRSLEDMKNDMKNSTDFERDMSNLSQYGQKENKDISATSFKQILTNIFILPVYHKLPWLKKMYKNYKIKKGSR